jgi:hypothetical protein
MLGWLAGGLWAWALWHWLGLHGDLSAQGLWLQELARRLAQGGGLHSWDLPPAFGLVPDLGVLDALRGLGADPERVQRWFGMILGLFAWKYLGRVIRRLWAVPKGVSRVQAAAGLLLGLFVAPLPGLGHWLVPGEHGSALVLALAAWAWGLKQKERPSGWAMTSLAALALGLAGAGDPWALLWALPVLGVLGLRLRRSAWLRLALGLLICLGSAWSGRQWLADQAGRLVEPSWAALGRFDAGLWQAQASLWWAALKVPLGVAALGLALWSWPLPGRASGLRVLGLGWWLAALASLWAAFSLQLSGAAWAFMLWPLVWLLPAFVVERWPAWDRAMLLALLLLALLPQRASAVAGASLKAQAQWLEASLGPERRYGWGAPALARGLRLASGQGLVLAGVLTTPQGVASPAWCADRELLSEGAALERPQFVVVNGLDEALLKARLGAPVGVQQGQGLNVWLLGQGAGR